MQYNTSSINGNVLPNDGTLGSLLDYDLTSGIQSNFLEVTDDECGGQICFNTSVIDCIRVNYDISPSQIPSLSMVLFLKQRSTNTNNYGWIMAHDNGVFDRGIYMHDVRFPPSGYTKGLAQGVGGEYTGLAPLTDNEYTFIVAVWNGDTGTAQLYVNDNAPLNTPILAQNDGLNYFCLNSHPLVDSMYIFLLC